MQGSAFVYSASGSQKAASDRGKPQDGQEKARCNTFPCRAETVLEACSKMIFSVDLQMYQRPEVKEILHFCLTHCSSQNRSNETRA